MKQCRVCQQKTINHFIERFKPDAKVEKEFVTKANTIIDNHLLNNAPEMATQLHRLGKEMFHCEHLYYSEKMFANDLLLQHYDYWKEQVNKSSDPFFAAAKLAVSGNIIDYGAHSVPDDIIKEVHTLQQKTLGIDQTSLLAERINKADNILYLGDNAGEIVFDKLFIETINHPGVTFVVRGKPIINDVVKADAMHVEMHNVCQVMDNGYDAPSTIIDKCSPEFRHAFDTADLIISKGQGNLEGLMDLKNDKIFFMLMAKCEPIAEKLGVHKGDLVVTTIK
ncbi:DUF89 family protein [Puteibacter caeruleilacunae]|nr:DUF89 family protein [Puteibacter caeruleilacunae]